MLHSVNESHHLAKLVTPTTPQQSGVKQQRKSLEEKYAYIYINRRFTTVKKRKGRFSRICPHSHN